MAWTSPVVIYHWTTKDMWNSMSLNGKTSCWKTWQSKAGWSNVLTTLWWFYMVSKVYLLMRSRVRELTQGDWKSTQRVTQEMTAGVLWAAPSVPTVHCCCYTAECSNKPYKKLRSSHSSSQHTFYSTDNPIVQKSYFLRFTYSCKKKKKSPRRI